MNNKFIMYCSCVNTIATVSSAVNTCITWGGGGAGEEGVITQHHNYEHR